MCETSAVYDEHTGRSKKSFCDNGLRIGPREFVRGDRSVRVKLAYDAFLYIIIYLICQYVTPQCKTMISQRRYIICYIYIYNVRTYTLSYTYYRTYSVPVFPSPILRRYGIYKINQTKYIDV